jgi:hypothetical protein
MIHKSLSRRKTMKNGNQETPAPKKLTVDDLKKVIGGTARPNAIDAEDSKGNKVHVE